MVCAARGGPGMAKLFAELRRRQMFRVAAAYAVVAWLLIQLVNNLAPMLRLPEWAGSFFLVVLIVGFPVVLVFAWVHELGAPQADGTTARAATAKLDWVLIGALAIAIGLMSYQQLAPSPSARAVQQAAVVPSAFSPGQPGGIPIAVLPFVNVSGEATQEFFSDGMTDEIASALARVPALRMVGRTSAFQFKGQNRDLRAIGQSLGATYLIEGSVRKAGERVRVTAQLVKADDGIGLWTENYDRELKDIFATQEDIAKAIAASLRAPLGLQQGESLISNRNIDTDSYEQYLRGRALVRNRSSGIPLTGALTLLEQVVARNPDYAPAWAQLALAHALTPNRDPSYFDGGSAEDLRRVVDASLPRAEAAAQRSIQLDPGLADGYLALARALDPRGKPLLAEEHYLKALALDPNNPDALALYSSMLAAVGRLKEALTMKQQALALEPYVPVYQRNTAGLLWLNGQNDAALALISRSPAGASRALYLARVYAALGRYAESADALLEIPAGLYPPGAPEEAARLLRTAPSTAASPNSLRPTELDFVYLYVGAPERLLDFYERNAEAGYTVAIDTLNVWHASVAPVRKTERFKTFARKAGLVEYWRTKGWPDLCRPVGADDFACD
jgi:adenylate cyclase